MTQMIRTGQTLVAVGILVMMIPGTEKISLMGLILVGLGCARVYPCIIHSTLAHFGADRSQLS